MRVLLDSNVLLRAVISPAGPARALLYQFRDHEDYDLVLSEHIIGEVERVLAEPRIQERLAVGVEMLSVLISEIRTIAEIVHPEPSSRVISDSNDQPVLDAAITAAVDVMCTVDKHFEESSVQAICRAHGIRIMDDVTLLAILRDLQH